MDSKGSLLRTVFGLDHLGITQVTKGEGMKARAEPNGNGLTLLVPGFSPAFVSTVPLPVLKHGGREPNLGCSPSAGKSPQRKHHPGRAL